MQGSHVWKAGVDFKGVGHPQYPLLFCQKQGQALSFENACCATNSTTQDIQVWL